MKNLLLIWPDLFDQVLNSIIYHLLSNVLGDFSRVPFFVFDKFVVHMGANEIEWVFFHLNVHFLIEVQFNEGWYSEPSLVSCFVKSLLFNEWELDEIIEILFNFLEKYIQRISVRSFAFLLPEGVIFHGFTSCDNFFDVI